MRQLHPVLLCSTALLLAASARLPAQQFATDDAGLVEYGACQLEAWVGQSSSWLLPACQAIRNLELSVGLGSVRHPNERSTEYVVQGKTLFRTLDQGRTAWGLAGGAGLDPIAQLSGEAATGVFAYIPVSVAATEWLTTHYNLGWSFEREENGGGRRFGSGRHLLTWALRADVAMDRRFTAIGEYFSETGAGPEFQLGLRTTLAPERLLLDISYGWPRMRGGRAAGFTVGVAWTPAPFLAARPPRTRPRIGG